MGDFLEVIQPDQERNLLRRAAVKERLETGTALERECVRIILDVLGDAEAAARRLCDDPQSRLRFGLCGMREARQAVRAVERIG